MGRIARALAPLGGVARTIELDAAGVGPGLIRMATGRGELIRIRKGWYADPATDPHIIRAIRIGGSLPCVSAARRHGLWVPEHETELNVAVPPTSARLRRPDHARSRLAENPDDAIVHWAVAARPTQRLADAIDLAARCEGPEVGFVLLESAIHLRRLDDGGRQDVISMATVEFAALARRAYGLSESGTESLVKLLLWEIGAPFQQQLAIPGVGQGDFLVGDTLILEADSREFHADPSRDRRRDTAASIRGLRCQRYMYSQLVHERDTVRSAIVAALIRGDHR